MRLIFVFLFIPALTFAQSKGISVYFNSGEVITTDYVYISETGLGGPFVKIGDRNAKRVSIRDIEHIEGKDQFGDYRYYKPIYVVGFTLWGERTYTSDRIEIFYTNVSNGGWNTNYKMAYYVYSKDGGPLKKMKYSFLKEDLSDNEASMEFVKKGNRLNITQAFLYVAGAAIIVAGIVQMDKNLEKSTRENTDLEIPPVLIGGLITYYVPFFMQGAKQNAFYEALTTYK